MKKLLFAISAMAIMLSSCSEEPVTNTSISGRFVGLNSNMVYLEQMSAAGQSVVDSVALANDGSFHFRIEEVPATPSLYNIIYSSDRIPLLVSRGENIELNAMGNVF